MAVAEAVLAPLQALFDAVLEALQAVALLLDQVKRLDPPLTTVVGLAPSETDGGDDEPLTVMVVDWLAEPPSPLQVSVYVPVLVSALNVWLVGALEAVLLPLQAPLAVHTVVLVLDQVSVELAPLVTVAGLAVSDTVGASETVTMVDWLAVPVEPVQVSVYVEVAVMPEIFSVPEVACAPDQAPLAVQALAFELDQVSVVDPLRATVDGLAVSAIEGLLVNAPLVQAASARSPAKTAITSSLNLRTFPPPADNLFFQRSYPEASALS